MRLETEREQAISQQISGPALALRRFYRALDFALGDIEEEKQRGDPRLVFDADVIIATIQGLTGWNPNLAPPDLRDPRWVVRALLVSGFLGRVSALPPHLGELSRYVGRIQQYGPVKAGYKKGHLWRLAEVYGLAHLEDRLVGDLSGSGLADAVADEGFEFFIKLELCYGGFPADRRSRVFRRLSLESPISPPARRTRDDVTEQLMRKLNADRPSTDTARWDFNNLVDAHALSDLGRALAEAKAPIRFYTETGALQRLGSEDILLTHDGRSVFRDAEYFVMRTSFDALRYPHLKSHDVGGADLTAEELTAIRDAMADVFHSPMHGAPSHTIDTLNAYRVKGLGVSLGELVRDFGELKFLGNVFLRWELPAELPHDFLPFVRSFFGRPEALETTRRALDGDFARLAHALSSSVDHLRTWKSDYQSLLRRLRAARERWASHRPTFARDLGLARWGLHLSLPHEVVVGVEEWLERVVESEHPPDLADDLALTVAAGDYLSDSHFAAVMCKLWAVRADDLLLREWQHSAHTESAMLQWPALEILSLVCEVKAVAAEQGAAAFHESRVLDSARALADRLGSDSDPVVQAGGAMGLAHTAYWAWDRSRDFNLTDPALGMSIAEESCAAALRAAALVEEGSIMWAFAINHFAYVGLRSGMRDDHALAAVYRLIGVNPNHDHFRFRDTRARLHTIGVRSDLESEGMDRINADRDMAARLCEELMLAQNLLLSHPAFGDQEVGEHLSEIAQLQRSLGCARIGASRPLKARQSSDPDAQ